MSISSMVDPEYGLFLAPAKDFVWYAIESGSTSLETLKPVDEILSISKFIFAELNVVLFVRDYTSNSLITSQTIWVNNSV